MKIGLNWVFIIAQEVRKYFYFQRTLEIRATSQKYHGSCLGVDEKHCFVLHFYVPQNVLRFSRLQTFHLKNKPKMKNEPKRNLSIILSSLNLASRTSPKIPLSWFRSILDVNLSLLNRSKLIHPSAVSWQWHASAVIVFLLSYMNWTHFTHSPTTEMVNCIRIHVLRSLLISFVLDSIRCSVVFFWFERLEGRKVWKVALLSPCHGGASPIFVQQHHTNHNENSHSRNAIRFPADKATNGN